MKNIHCLIAFVYLVFFWHVSVMSQCIVDAEREVCKDEIQKKVEGVAERLRILPLDTISFYDTRGKYRRPPIRSDLRFEDYKTFFEFRKYVQNLSKEEVFACREIDLSSTTPKARALLLILLFLAEQTHRVDFRPHDPMFADYYRNAKTWCDISGNEWNLLADVIKKHENDTMEAFPSVEIAEKDANSRYASFMNENEMMLKKCIALINDTCNDVDKHENISVSELELRYDLLCKTSNIPQEKADEIALYFEYAIAINRAGAMDAIIRNSSSEPKTVAGIAISLMKSRGESINRMKKR